MQPPEPFGGRYRVAIASGFVDLAAVRTDDLSVFNLALRFNRLSRHDYRLRAGYWIIPHYGTGAAGARAGAGPGGICG